MILALSRSHGLTTYQEFRGKSHVCCLTSTNHLSYWMKRKWDWRLIMQDLQNGERKRYRCKQRSWYVLWKAATSRKGIQAYLVQGLCYAFYHLFYYVSIHICGCCYLWERRVRQYSTHNLVVRVRMCRVNDCKTVHICILDCGILTWA